MAEQLVIDVGARIQVLQSSISDMQKILDRLQPNTSGWKQLESIFRNMRAELDKLILQNGKPVVDPKQFTMAEKSIDKLEAAMGKAKLTIDRLKVSDIKFTPEQQSQFDNFKKQIEDAKTAFEDFKKNVTQDFLNTGNNQNILTSIFKGGIVSKDLDEINTKVTERLAELQGKIAEFNQRIERESLGTAISKALSGGPGKGVSDVLSNKELGLNFFDKNGNFASGMKQQFYDLLASTFKMGDSEKAQLQQLSAKELRKLFEGEQIKGQGIGNFLDISRFQGDAESIDKLRQQLAALRDEQIKLGQLQGIDVSQDQIAQQAEKVAEKTNALQQSMANLSKAALESAKNSALAGQGFNSLTSQTQQLRQALQDTNAQFLQMERVRTSFNAMKMAIVNFMGFRQVLNLVKRGVKEALTHIKELDTVMNKISIVTDMSTGDLWKQVDAYSKLAQTYGVSIKGAYEVSQIYYQQGLETKDVMTLTNETLKLSKVSGLDYATTTDYMTTALRGFKMEMSEASTVVDVYSALAANTAVSQEELAVAMSKTASSMEGVGASFEESSAMIATMVAVTRESATNIGSALKSIASRYGELTKDPAKLIDSEGEAMAFNKVDAALQSVGISMKTTDGQFRNFTDVIVELAEKWNTLESTQQRYIATQFAGNRQQSRFLALVSNADLLKQNLSVAENSEDTGTLQALKALDSIESKIEQVRVAYQQFYTTIGAEGAWKGFLDGAKNVLDTLNGLPKLFDTIPIGAISVIGSILSLIKNAGTTILTQVAQWWISAIPQAGQAGTDAATSFTTNLANGMNTGINKGFSKITNPFKDIVANWKGSSKFTDELSKNNQYEQYLKEQSKVQSQQVATPQYNVAEVEKQFNTLQERYNQFAGQAQSIPLKFDVTQPNISIEDLKNKIANLPISVDTLNLQQQFNTAFENVSGVTNIPININEADIKAKMQDIQATAQKLNINLEINNDTSLDDLKQKLIDIKTNSSIKLDARSSDALDGLIKNIDDYIEKIQEANNTPINEPVSNPVASSGGTPTQDYAAIDAITKDINGTLESIAAKGQKLSPREAQAAYQKLNQEIQQMSAELEKVKINNPDSSKIQECEKALEKAKQKAQELNQSLTKTKVSSMGLSSAAGGLNMLATLFNNGTESGYALSGTIMGIAGALYLVDGISKAMTRSNPWMALAMGVMGLVNGISQLANINKKKIEILTKKAEELTTKAQQAKSEEKTLQQTVSNLEKLKEKRYESAEAAQEYTEAVNDLTTKFPGLIGGFDEAGNAILNAAAQERLLAQARQKTAKATYEAAEEEYKVTQAKLESAESELTSKGTGILGQSSTKIREEILMNDKIKEDTYSQEESSITSQLMSWGNATQISDMTLGNSRAEEILNKAFQSIIPTAEDTLATWTNKVFDKYLKDLATEFDNTSMQKFSEAVTKYKSSSQYNTFLTTPDELSAFQNLQETLSQGIIPQEIVEFSAAAEDWANSDKSSTLAVKKFETMVSAYESIYKKFDNDTEKMKEAGIDVEKLNSQRKIIDDWIKFYSELSDLNEAFRANGVAVAAAWQSYKGQNKQYIQNGSSMMNIATTAIVKAAKDSGKSSWTDYINSVDGIQDTNNILDLVNNQYLKLMGRYSSDGEELTTLFDKMMADASSYGYEDIVNTFQFNDEKFNDYLRDYYKTLSDTLYNNLNNFIGSQTQSTGVQIIQGAVQTLYDSTHLLVSDEAALLTDLTKIVSNLDAQGFSSLGQTVATLGVELFNAIEGIQDSAQQNNVSDIIRKNGLQTREGIQASIDAIKNMGFEDNSPVIQNLTQLRDSIISNIPLAIQTATSNLLSTWEDTSKELTKAMSGGVSLKEADALISKAQSMGMDFGLSDFISSGDKLILTAKKFNEYWEKLNETNQKNVESWQSSINTGQQIFTTAMNHSGILPYSENDKKILTELGFDITDSKYYSDGKLTNDGIRELNRVINENQKNLNEYNLAAQIAADQLKNSWDRSQGIYKLNTEGEALLVDELKEIASGKNFDLQTSEGVTKKAIKESLNNAYNSLISDVLSKGFDNIDLSQYEGLINLGEGIELSGSYQDFVKNYVDLAGKTIEETNALIVQAIEKDQQKTIGAADIVKNFKFLDQNTVAASLKDLQSLADAFGVDFQNWVDSGVLKNQLANGLYVFDTKELDGIDWDNISEIKNIIADAINDYFDSIADAMSKGLKGTLTNADVTSLNESLQYLGLPQLDTQLDFTKTAEGLKLTQQAAIGLYHTLKDIDAVRAKIVFDDLSKSLQENNEHYKNVQDIMAHIVELQNKINEADSKGNTTRADQYREELSLAKEILEVRSTQEDSSFDFMSNKIPGGQNNPLNYYSSWQKAIKVIQEGAKTKGKKGKKGYAKGFIDYQDWYNIATELGNLAALGAPIELAGVRLDGSLEKTSELIQKGADSLTAVDTGELKVNIGKIGLDVLGGANELSDGVDAGIQAMARSQIDMLDGIIAMLEAVVAMEQLGDIAGGDNVIDLGDMGLKIENEGVLLENVTKFKKATDIFREATEKMGEASEQVKIGDKSLSEIAETLQEAAKTGKVQEALDSLGLTGDQLQQLFNGFYQLSQREDWGKEGASIKAMIEEQFAGTGLAINVDIDPWKNLKVNWDSSITKDRLNYLFPKDNFKTQKEKMQAAINQVNQKNTTQLQWKQNYEIGVLTGKVSIKTDKKTGKKTASYKGFTNEKDIGTALILEAQGVTGIKKQTWNTSAGGKGKVSGYAGTISMEGQSVQVLYKPNSKNPVLYRVGKKTYTNGEKARQAVQLANLKKGKVTKSGGTLGKEDEKLKGITGKQLQNLQGGTTATVQVGSREIQVISTKTGIKWWSSECKQWFDSYDAMIKAEVAKAKGTSGTNERISQTETEIQEIENGAIDIQLINDKFDSSKLEKRQINNLRNTTSDQIIEEWNKAAGDKHEQAKLQWKYGIKLEYDDNGTVKTPKDSIQGIIDDLNAAAENETTNMNLNVTAVAAGANKDVVQQILNKETIVVPVQLEVGTGVQTEVSENQEGASTTSLPIKVDKLVIQSGAEVVLQEGYNPTVPINTIDAILSFLKLTGEPEALAAFTDPTKFGGTSSDYAMQVISAALSYLELTGTPQGKMNFTEPTTLVGKGGRGQYKKDSIAAELIALLLQGSPTANKDFTDPEQLKDHISSIQAVCDALNIQCLPGTSIKMSKVLGLFERIYTLDDPIAVNAAVSLLKLMGPEKTDKGDSWTDPTKLPGDDLILEASVALLNLIFGNDKEGNARDANDCINGQALQDAITAWSGLNGQQKTVTLAGILLSVTNAGVSLENEADKAALQTKATTAIQQLLTSVGVDAGIIDLTIEGFNLIYDGWSPAGDQEIDPKKLQAIQNALNKALAEAGVKGEIDNLKLIITGMKTENINWTSVMDAKTGAINLGALKGALTIEGLQILAINDALEGATYKGKENSPGVIITIDDAKAKITGFKSIDITAPIGDEEEYTIQLTNVNGEVVEAKIGAELFIATFGDNFNPDGSLKDPAALSVRLNNLTQEQLQKLYDQIQNKFNTGFTTPLVGENDNTSESTRTVRSKVAQLNKGVDFGYGTTWTQEEDIKNAGLVEKGKNNNYYPTKELEDYVDSLYRMVNAGQQLSNIDLDNLLLLSYNNKTLMKTEEGRKLSDFAGSIRKEALGLKKDLNDWLNQLGSATTISPETIANLVQLGNAIKTLATNAKALETMKWNKVIEGLNNFNKTTGKNKTKNKNKKENIVEVVIKILKTKEAKAAIENLKQQISKVASEIPITVTITGDDEVTTSLTGISTLLTEIAGKKEQTITINYETNGSLPSGEGPVSATGNVSLATGNALGKGTLMGELGPELVVSHGRYFVVGQNGAEFVNLDDDAIVFNHLQTQSLLKNGKATRGKARTNDKNAIGMAKGNVNGGPAMASAAAALANLKQIRAMWQQLLDASVSDMATKAGGGGGGGGGGKKGAAFMKEVERWYTLMQKIAQLEKDINYQEQLRNKIVGDRNKTGSQYFTSQAKSLTDIAKEVGYQKELALSQEKYFNQRRQELNTRSAFSKLYTFDESGQLIYNDKAKLKNGKKGGLNFLSELFATDTKTGGAKHSDKEKYNMLKSAGLIGDKVYDENGQLIEKGKGKQGMEEYYTNVVKAFSAKVDSEKEEMQKLHDSIDDANEKVLELDQQRNEILQDMTDKQLELEEKIMQAVQDSKQAQIDSLQKLRDATEEANQKYLDGLSKALEREQNMYQKNESQNDLDKMRRQLAILQRSGGSASQIASLQNDIRSKEQDQYFEDRQSQIDAIQQASDKQIERMDKQIDIMQKTLDYQIENGLLWKDVNDIMQKSPNEIAAYIQNNTKDYMSKSLTDLEQVMKDVTFLAEYWTASKKEQEKLKNKRDVDEEWKGQTKLEWDNDKKKWVTKRAGGTAAALKKQYGDKVWNKAGKKAQEAYYKEYERTGDPRAATEAAEKELIKANGGKKAGEGKTPSTNPEPTKPSKEPKKTKTTANLGRYQVKDGKTKFLGWSSLKAGQKTPAAPKINGYSVSTSSNVPKNGAVAGKTYKVTYTYTKITGYKVYAYVDLFDSAGKKIDHVQSWGEGKTLELAKKSLSSNANGMKNRTVKNRKVAKVKTRIFKTVPQYKKGGLVDYTGIAQVHGSPSKPEAFLNAEQTATLKQGLLGGKNSLVSVLADFQAMLDGSARSSVYNSIDRGGVNIENASVNMNVGSIANDYDARRAGEQALEEMLKIARKTGATSVSRR